MFIYVCKYKLLQRHQHTAAVGAVHSTYPELWHLPKAPCSLPHTSQPGWLSYLFCKVQICAIDNAGLLPVTIFNTIQKRHEASQVALVVKNSPANAGDRRDLTHTLCLEDPLEEGMATHSSTLAWRIPWTEEPGGLQSIGLQRVEQNWGNLAHMQKCHKHLNAFIKLI